MRKGRERFGEARRPGWLGWLDLGLTALVGAIVLPLFVVWGVLLLGGGLALGLASWWADWRELSSQRCSF